MDAWGMEIKSRIARTEHVAPQTMLVIFWLRCSDAAIKCLAVVQGLYMNLVSVQSAHNKGAWLASCTVYVLLMLVMNSRLEMRTVLPKWLFNVH